MPITLWFNVFFSVLYHFYWIVFGFKTGGWAKEEMSIFTHFQQPEYDFNCLQRFGRVSCSGTGKTIRIKVLDH